MPEYKSLPPSKILVPDDRARAVDEDHALAIKASILETFQITPITIRKTPRGKAPYTLVAGAHRHRAFELMSDREIDCIVVQADKQMGKIAEVTENLFRHDLNALDRAIAIQVYRDEWEIKHGKIYRGQRNNPNSVNVTELMEHSAKSGFTQDCADRMGLSTSAVEKASLIAKRLPPDLRKVLARTPVAKNQSQLLKLAKLNPDQRKVAAKAVEFAKGNFEDMMSILDDGPVKKKPTAHQKAYSKMVDSWSRGNSKVKREFLELIWPEIEKLRPPSD